MRRGAGAGQGAERVCASAWVVPRDRFCLLGLSQGQRDAEAYCDSCCTGELLCGSQRAKRLLKRLEHWQVLVPEGAAYRFGRGGAEVTQAYTVRCGSASGGRAVELNLEVVAGSLPLLLGKKGLAKLGVSVLPQDLAKLRDDELPTHDLAVKSKSTASKCYVGVEGRVEPQGKPGQHDLGRVGEEKAEKQTPEWPTPKESVERPADAKPTERSSRALRYERRRQRKKAAKRESGDEFELALLEVEREKQERQQEPLPSNSQGAEAYSQRKAEELAAQGEKEAAQENANVDDGARATTAGRKKKRPAREARKAGLKGRRPKVLALSDRDLIRIHEGSHRGMTALWHFLKSQVPRGARRVWKSEMNGLRDRLKAMVDGCKKCNAYRRRQKGVQKVSERVAPNRRVWGDLMCLDKSQEIWALVLVDESTAWGEGYVVTKPTTEKAWAEFWQWCARNGPPREFVTDRGGEFVTEKFVAECEAIGVWKRTSAGSAPDAHGRVERVIETVRWTLDRRGENGKRKTAAEWATVLSTVFNAANNEVRRGEGSASERWHGRGTSTWLNVLSEDDAGAGSDTAQFQRIREETLEDYRAVVNCSKLRAILRQRTMRGVDRDELTLGTQVWVFRDSGKKTGKRNPRWVGPATVVGVDEYYAHVDRGGVLLCARFKDLKLVSKPVETPDAGRMEVSGKGAEHFEFSDSSEENEDGDEQSPDAKWMSRDDEGGRVMEHELCDSSSEEESSSEDQESTSEVGSATSSAEESGSDEVGKIRRKLVAMLSVCPKNRQRARSWKKHRAKVATCFAALGMFRPVENSVQQDWMGVEWDDLDEERKQAAIERAMDDYDEFRSWDAAQECRRGDLQWRGVQVLSGRWVKKAKWKLSEDGSQWLLGGRARWTPRGFEERGVSREEAESPTAAVSSHFMVEALGNAYDWTSIRCDISSAFFQSREFGRNEKEIWLELPPEYQPQGEATPKSEKLCRRMLKEVPGTKMAPRKWQERLEEELRRGGWEEVSVEKCLWAKRSKNGLEGLLGTHVDDLRGRMTPKVAAELEALLRRTLKVGEFRVDERGSEFVGLQWEILEDGTKIWQQAYAEQKLRELELPKHRWKERAHPVTDAERKAMYSVVGQLRWLCRTRPDISYEVSMMSSLQSSEWLRVADLESLNKLVRHVKGTASRGIVIPKLRGELSVLAVVDAGDPPDSDSYDGRWRVAHGVSLTGSNSPGKVAPLCWVAHKATRVCHASFDAECVGGVEAVDNGLDYAMLTRELLYGRRPSLLTKLEQRWGQDGRPRETDDARPVVMTTLHTDADGVVQKVRKLCLRGMSKRRKNDIADIQELVAIRLLNRLVHIAGKLNPFDALTKHKSRTKKTMERLVEWQMGVYEAR